VLSFVLVAVFAPWLTPYGPTEMLALAARQAPCRSHPFGTDLLGRDVLTRVLFGARSILSLTGLGALIAVAAGTAIGLMSGYLGGWLDEIVMRVFDSLLAIPALLLALVLLGAVGQSQWTVLLVIAVVYVPVVARVVRSEVIAVKSLGFVEAARLRGEATAYILFREIAPSVLPALSVEAALRFSYGIFLVASLGYLGVGVQPPTPDWGLMVKEARSAVRIIPWALYFPAGAISALVIGVNLAADGLKSALQMGTAGLSPRVRRRVLVARNRTLPSGKASDSVLSIQNLTVSYLVHRSWLDALREIHLELPAGRTLGIVGESGSGKSTLALSIVQHLSANGAIRAGRILFQGASILGQSYRELQQLRGRCISMVPQDPMASLNPSMTIGKQLAETVRLQGSGTRKTATEVVIEMLGAVHIADSERVVRQHPHELSGGMQQRVVIAMALASNPTLLLLDEPTTGLDVTTEAVILDLVGELLEDPKRSSLYISHDLGVVSRVSDLVAVLYAGELVECGNTNEIFTHPRHPYTLGLIESIPRIAPEGRRSTLLSMAGSIPSLSELPSGCVFRPRCRLAGDVCRERPRLVAVGAGRETRIRCHRWQQTASLQPVMETSQVAQAAPSPIADAVPLALEGLAKRFKLRRSVRELARNAPVTSLRAVDGITLSLSPGRTMGWVGESGSGKTTLARVVLGLEPATEGKTSLGDHTLPSALRQRDRSILRRIQAVSQNPDQALNPYLPVGVTLGRQLTRLAPAPRSEVRQKVGRLLEVVGLDGKYVSRLPQELSGGEKQRVAIARAIATAPEFVLCDEATSALDVSVQARILNLLARLQREVGSGYAFISHDLAVVAHLADEIAVMYLGRILEQGTTSNILRPPHHPYTEALLSSVHGLHADLARTRIRLSGNVPSPVEIPQGCPFHSRCPRKLGDICESREPTWQSSAGDHFVFCHIPLPELRTLQSLQSEGTREQGGRR